MCSWRFLFWVYLLPRKPTSTFTCTATLTFIATSVLQAHVITIAFASATLHPHVHLRCTSLLNPHPHAHAHVCLRVHVMAPSPFTNPAWPPTDRWLHLPPPPPPPSPTPTPTHQRVRTKCCQLATNRNQVVFLDLHRRRRASMIRTGTPPRHAALTGSAPLVGEQAWCLQPRLLCQSSQGCLPCHLETSTSCAPRRPNTPTVSDMERTGTLTRSARNLSKCASPHTTLHGSSQHSAPM